MNKYYRVEETPTTNGIGQINKVLHFNSINDFVQYISETETNRVFKSRHCSTDERSNEWNGNMSLKEAIDTLHHGWSAGAIDLEKKLKVTKHNMAVEKEVRNILDVCGYQPIVPLYLNGAPNCMLRKQPQAKKQKVLTINRSLCASGGVSSKTLMEESTKVLQIIYKIEKMGYRINLNLVISCGLYAVSIRLKSAGERLSVSKLAFPLVHTAMFRRLFFRFIEVSEYTTDFHRSGYGKVPFNSEFDEICSRGNDIHLPTVLNGFSDEDVKRLTVDELIDKLK